MLTKPQVLDEALILWSTVGKKAEEKNSEVGDQTYRHHRAQIAAAGEANAFKLAFKRLKHTQSLGLALGKPSLGSCVSLFLGLSEFLVALHVLVDLVAPGLMELGEFRNDFWVLFCKVVLFAGVVFEVKELRAIGHIQLFDCGSAGREFVFCCNA